MAHRLLCSRRSKEWVYFQIKNLNHFWYENCFLNPVLLDLNPFLILNMAYLLLLALPIFVRICLGLVSVISE